jgi:hypothetical protein
MIQKSDSGAFFQEALYLARRMEEDQQLANQMNPEEFND